MLSFDEKKYKRDIHMIISTFSMFFKPGQNNYFNIFQILVNKERAVNMFVCFLVIFHCILINFATFNENICQKHVKIKSDF